MVGSIPPSRPRKWPLVLGPPPPPPPPLQRPCPPQVVLRLRDPNQVQLRPGGTLSLFSQLLVLRAFDSSVGGIRLNWQALTMRGRGRGGSRASSASRATPARGRSASRAHSMGRSDSRAQSASMDVDEPQSGLLEDEGGHQDEDETAERSHLSEEPPKVRGKRASTGGVSLYTLTFPSLTPSGLIGHPHQPAVDRGRARQEVSVGQQDDEIGLAEIQGQFARSRNVA